jgi:hypothetical protein
MIRRIKTLIEDLQSRPNASTAIRQALRDPRLLLRYARRTGSSAWIRALVGKQQDYEGLVRELEGSGLPERLEHALAQAFSSVSGATVRGVPYVHGAMKTIHVRALYAIVRTNRPATIVETGVCNGYSTAILLEALRRNAAGHLYSVDLPEVAGDVEGGRQFWAGKGGAVIPAGRPSGWLVPEDLEGRWAFSQGRSADLLPPLLERLGEIDLFIHDSEHSFENQIFEFRLAWRHLRPGGLLAASDLNTSRAFVVFSEEIRNTGRVYFVDDGLAMIVKGP